MPPRREEELKRVLNLAFLVWLAPSLQAQDSASALISQIAGQHLYLDLSIELAPGDTLVLHDGASPEHLLVVVASDSTRAVATFAGQPFALTRGVSLSFTVRPGAAVVDQQRPAGPTPYQQASSGHRPRAKPVLVSGRLLLTMDGQRTRTEGLGADPEVVEREFATPVAALRLGLAQLPGGMELDANLSASHRYVSGDLIQPQTLVRVYQLSLTKSFASLPLMFRLGRFYNPYERFSGYWDGGLVYLGGSGIGGGLAAGFEPQRANDGFSSSFPKAALFLKASGRAGATGFRSDLSLHRVFARDTTPAHTFAGWSVTGYSGRAYLNTSLQVDRNPESNRLAVTRLLASLELPAGRTLTLRAGLSRRQPYLLGPAIQVMPFRRDRLSGGLVYRNRALSLGAELAWSQQDGLNSLMSYSGNLRVYRLIAGLGLSLSGSHWTASGPGERGYLLSLRGDRDLGQFDARAGYQYYRSEFAGVTDQSHLVDGGVRTMLSGNTSVELGIRIRRGERLRSDGLSASIWWAF